ncbi:MAG: hypothetical protein DDT19_01212 [Syntrophomonadaceae bacterium]|nr:hypothetical protein [Bacillota bacterium]
MYNPHYCSFIQPASPLVKNLVERFDRTLDPSPIVLALAALKEFKYIGVLGIQPLETVILAKKGNCLSLASLVCSMLRVAGLAEEEVFVALGHWRGFYREPVHAWVIVIPKDSENIWFIDPARKHAECCKLDDLLHSYCLIIMFNDRQFLLIMDEKRKALSLRKCSTDLRFKGAYKGGI